MTLPEDDRPADEAQPTTGIGRRLTKWLAAIVLVLVGGAALAGLWTHLMQPPPREIHSGKALVGGPFVLVSQDGQTISDATFRGRPMLVTFGYTRDADFTRATMQTIAEAMRALGRTRGDRIAALFVTLDPDFDTPAKLKTFLAEFGLPMIGATGQAADVFAMAKVYRLPFSRSGAGIDGKNATIEFEPLIYLMNSDGEYVTHLTHEATPNELMLAIAQLL